MSEFPPPPLVDPPAASGAAQAAIALGLISSLAACGGGGDTATTATAAVPLAAPETAITDLTLITPPSRAAKAADALPVDATALFNWAQKAYAQYFPTNEANQAWGPYIYRYYAGTGNYLGVAGNNIYIMGPVSGGALAYVGTLDNFSCQIAPSNCASAPASGAEAARFLAQATLGGTHADVSAMQASTFAGWIDAQFSAPASQGHYDWLVAKGFGDETYRNSLTGLDNTLWRKFISSTDALRQRVTLALSEICVVSVLGINAPWRQFAVANYVDILEANAFGNYRTLLDQVTLSTAMGYYLTYRGNAKANVTTGSQPDENYARELMQLFTLGLYKLNADGSSTGVETYGQADVSGLARVFTGWDLDTSALASPVPPAVHKRPMAQVASRYETGAKTFLGVTVPAGTAAAASLKTALDTLFNHPNLPPFVSRQLIQRLITSNPSAAYVGRVSAVFADNGAGVRGDMKSVIKAILLDTEARDLASAGSTSFGKLREPVQRFLNWARAFGAASSGDLWPIGDLSDPAAKLGQSPLRSPSVFNFFRPGYVPPNSPIATAGLEGPEFQITTESSVAGYVNFMQKAVAGSGIGDVRANYASLTALASDSAALLAEVNLVLAAGQVSAATLAVLKAAVDTIAASTDAGKLNRVYAAVTLVLAAPEYIAQK